MNTDLAHIGVAFKEKDCELLYYEEIFLSELDDARAAC